jgi:hypothetical protein
MEKGAETAVEPLLCGHEYGHPIAPPAATEPDAGGVEQLALPGTSPDEPALPGM